MNNELTLDDYQAQAEKTAIYDEKYKIVYPALGLTNESGEVAGKIKKVLRDNAGDFSDEKKKDTAYEIGDVLWYAAALAHDLGYTLGDIAQMNLDKLASRAKRGTLHGSGDNR